ncbi:polysaccharide pyruvyl transferase family protein [Algibacter sp. Ld11]|uniref:polysaccharide pyruvyl transferase family protein n=1 Tax=Algibacter sp. Ld11 TaxID=649150 RepID=UPI00386F9F70
MSKINMFWYKVPYGKKNFGDVLGPYIVKKLSGKKIAYIPILHRGLKRRTFIAYPAAIYTRKLSFNDIIDNIKYLFGKDNVLISIGSIIGWHSSPKVNIWGTGIMSRGQHIDNANFFAVRGKYTQKRLLELGYQSPSTLGDPALLMPLLYKSNSPLKFKIGIVPHHFHYENTISKTQSKNIKVINLLENINQVIDEVCSCEILISSSLHGIIIAHAYKKPCLWYNLSNRTIGGDNIKFADYFSSIDIEEYKAIDLKIDKFDDASIKLIEDLIINRKDIAVADEDKIRELQKGLIKSAPFHIRDEFLC